MLYWTDGLPDSTRTRNCKFTWQNLQRLEQYLKDSNVDIVCKLIDFSPTKIIEDCTEHDPYPLSVFKKSEKINKSLNKSNSDFFGIIDSDAFISDDQYNTILELCNILKKSDVYTFDLKDIENTGEVINYDDGTFNRENVTFSSRYPDGANPGLGGAWLSCTDTLKSFGGFNEEFTGWGGEDGEVFGKLWMDGNVNTVKNWGDINVWHLPHFCDRENSLYFNREEYQRLNF